MDKFAFFDFDKTISDTDLMPDVLFQMEKDGIIKNYANGAQEIIEKYQKGVITYNERAVESWKYNVEFLKGQKVADVLKYIKEKFQVEKHIFPWVTEVMTRLKKEGYVIYVLSASLHEAVNLVKDKVKADHIIGSKVEIVDGVFTNTILDIVNAEAKLRIVKEVLTDEKDYVSIGVGDSIGDFNMLNCLGKKYLYNPQPDDKVKGEELGYTIINDDTIWKIVSDI
jgi:HAD superfamily hydrolase (TIGR01490 family)